uniref:Uncharacterized protein n=1 Tax=Hordeum vulgare subsp. vulgare TaxID=112509 RepID=A0A8I6XZD4_HORVV
MASSVHYSAWWEDIKWTRCVFRKASLSGVEAHTFWARRSSIGDKKLKCVFTFVTRQINCIRGFCLNLRV